MRRLYSSIRVHRSDDVNQYGTFVSVHATQGQSERSLDVIESVRGGKRVSRTVLTVDDSTYRVWNV